jgi:cation diffusion facilitator family transporter
MAGESRAAVAAALLGNAGLAVLKGVAAAVTGSASMLAETFHSIADTGNQALLLLGMRLARRPPDRRHPFGHGHAVYFWAFVVSMMLFSLGGGFSIWEGVRHYLHPSERRSLAWAYGVLAGAIVFEAGSLAVALWSLWRAKGHRTVLEYWRDARDPTLLTVVCEDSAALVALCVAAAGTALAQFTGDTVWDAAASIVIGLILIGIATLLAVENYSLLLGETAPAHVRRTIERVLGDDRAVRAVRDLRTMHLGPRSLLIVASVELVPGLETASIEATVTRLRSRLTEVLGEVTNPHLIVIEPGASVPGVRRPGDSRRRAAGSTAGS